MTHLPPQSLPRLSRFMAPPSSGKRRITRPLHPDWILLALTAVLPVFIIGIWNTQRGSLVPILALLALFFGLYFLRRNMLISRYHQELAAQQAEKTRVEKSIELWMKLYYCARDDGIFLPGRKELIPLDQIDQYLSTKTI